MRELRSWMVFSWPKHAIRANHDGSNLPRLAHWSTHVDDDSADGAPRRGETCWYAEINERKAIAMAWQWVEVRPDLVAVRDPNTIVTNALWQDADGELADELRGIVYANLMVFQTPWQARVLQALRRQGRTKPLRRSLQLAPQVSPMSAGVGEQRLAA